MKIKLYEEDKRICKNCNVENCPQTDDILELCLTDDMSSEMLISFLEERAIKD